MPGIDVDGYELWAGVFTEAETDDVLGLLPPVPAGSAGLRNLHQFAWIQELAVSSAMAGAAFSILGESAVAVRVLFFDKQPEANWKLPYHQDVTIAVAEECRAEGYGPWSVKDGIPHVQPPAEILERMVAVRLHLDDCGPQNGALRVIPGSHTRGRLAPDAVASVVSNSSEAIATARKGDLLLMRPLLLHASSPSASPVHRRVLHIEYCSAALPGRLQWSLGWPVRHSSLPQPAA